MMKRKDAKLLGLFVILLLFASTGCAPSTMIEKFADDAKEQIARDYLHRLATGDSAGLIAELDPALRTDNNVTSFQQMRALLPNEEPTVTNLVGYHWSKSDGVSSYNLTYQFGFGAKWVLANAAWRELSENRRQIIGMSVRPLPEPLQQTHAFTFRRAGPKHYLFFLLTVTIPVFVLVTLVVCIRTKFPRRKWLWIVFVLVGLVRVSLNWTTGETGVAPITVLLFGASALRASVYSPWIISFAVPIGALIFWIRRARGHFSTPPPVPSSSLGAPPTLPPV